MRSFYFLLRRFRVTVVSAERKIREAELGYFIFISFLNSIGG